MPTDLMLRASEADRAAAAYATETVDELQALVSDLPIAPRLESEPKVDRRAAWFNWAGVRCRCDQPRHLDRDVAGRRRTALLLARWVIGPWGAVLLLFHVTGPREACS